MTVETTSPPVEEERPAESVSETKAERKARKQAKKERKQAAKKADGSSSSGKKSKRKREGGEPSDVKSVSSESNPSEEENKAKISSSGKSVKRAKTEAPASAAKTNGVSVEDGCVIHSPAAMGTDTSAANGQVENDDGPVDMSHQPIENFDLSESTLSNLRTRGIDKLFPIQCQTFTPLMEGCDLMGRARTGMGKTLAFALPIIEKVLAGGVRKTRGRPPVAVVLTPTRELAKQVARDFEETTKELSSLVVYGGVPIYQQTQTLKQGVDIVIGTPGRVIDHLQQGTLQLNQVQFVVLDEADQMLDMGFADDVDQILRYVPDLDSLSSAIAHSDRAKIESFGKSKSVQTILFSATLPKWVNDVSRKYMYKPKVVDLVKEGDQQASTDVQHFILQSHWQQRAQIVGDLIRYYGGSSGRTIIFTETKKEANELVVDQNLKVDAAALHGDIAQSQREITLQAFRNGDVKCLVATDVAARGLDIKGVDLVVQTKPPRGNFSGKADVDTYVHRSGRTGRAGRKGTCITLFTPSQESLLTDIEKQTGTTFTRIGRPQPADLVKAAAAETVDKLSAVEDEAKHLFEESAKNCLDKYEPQEALARALAVISGYTSSMGSRSLLNSSDNFVTCVFKSPIEMRNLGFAWNAVKRDLPESVVNEIKGMCMSADSMEAYFDILKTHVKQVKQAIQGPNSRLSFATELAQLKPKPSSNNREQFGGGRGRGGGGRGGGRGRGRGGGRGFGRR
eukprot:gb/GECG01000876.1/.p1 GENE.gb/GECG01000876.1/~~gb/GECG01000876.1/.p1  ORF type:complete len:737 (+),score=111.09 gb/GECG01000876.1/:1-2211(+)